MSEEFDLDAYLNRIQYGGGVSPTLDTLTGMLLAHTARIPFEGLDVLLGRPVKLDILSTANKLVRDKRGGYCFEHGTLLAAALRTVGFQPVSHSARVTLFLPRSEAPRTHMFLTVPLAEGSYVVDPGFGGLAPRTPLLVPEGDQSSCLDEWSTHWLVRDGRYFALRIRTDEKISDAWHSTLEAENPIDFVLGNHFTSTHPNSPFVNRIMLRAFSGDQIVTVMNRDVTIRRNGESETYQLSDRAALRTLLIDHFGFDLPEIENVKVPSIPEWE